MFKPYTFVMVALTLIPVATGCAVEEAKPTTGAPITTPPSDSPENVEQDDDDVVTGTCDADEVRGCKVWIDDRNCFVGEQACDNGAWGDCLEPVED